MQRNNKDELPQIITNISPPVGLVMLDYFLTDKLETWGKWAPAEEYIDGNSERRSLININRSEENVDDQKRYLEYVACIFN